MCPTFCRNTLVLLLLSALHIIGPGFVSSEELSCSEMIPMMVVGAKVVRGTDWKWGNQDRNGTGTVTRPVSAGWVSVKWADNSTNGYRMNATDACDLKVVPQTTKPTVSSSSNTTQIYSYSSRVTALRIGNTTSSTPPSPTSHECTCSKQITESQAKTGADASELAKEAGKLSVETAKVALDAAKASASAEEAKRQLEVEAMKVALESARSIAKAEEAERLLVVEAKKVALAAAKSIAKAEEAKATEALFQVEAKKVALEVARSIAKAEEAEKLLEVEAKKMALEAAKSIAKAEESWATNEAEELIFKRDRRNQTLQGIITDKR